MHLKRHFCREPRPRRGCPALRVIALSKEHAANGEPGEIRGVVIPIDLAYLEILCCVFTVQIEGAEESRPKRRSCPRCGRLENMKEPTPGDDPQCDFHRDRPIHGPPIRIRRNPLVNHVTYDRSTVLFLCMEICLAQTQQPL